MSTAPHVIKFRNMLVLLLLVNEDEEEVDEAGVLGFLSPLIPFLFFISFWSFLFKRVWENIGEEFSNLLLCFSVSFLFVSKCFSSSSFVESSVNVEASEPQGGDSSSISHGVFVKTSIVIFGHSWISSLVSRVGSFSMEAFFSPSKGRSVIGKNNRVGEIYVCVKQKF